MAAKDGGSVLVVVLVVVTVASVVVVVLVPGGAPSVSAQLCTSTTMRVARRVVTQRAGRRTRHVRRPFARRSPQQTIRPGRPHVERRRRRRQGRRSDPAASASRMTSRVHCR
jgi:hypothetical protein